MNNWVLAKYRGTMVTAVVQPGHKLCRKSFRSFASGCDCLE